MSDASAQNGGYQPHGLPISTTFTAPHGQEIEQELGLVWGLTVRSMGFGRSFTSSFKSLQRGEVPSMTQNLDEGRQESVDRMVAFAQELGATAIIGVRFDSNTVGENDDIQEIIAYGTAVKTSAAGAS